MSDPPVACITGATSGIGRAFAEAYAKLGYDLILIGRRQALLEKMRSFSKNITMCSANACSWISPQPTP